MYKYSSEMEMGLWLTLAPGLELRRTSYLPHTGGAVLCNVYMYTSHITRLICVMHHIRHARTNIAPIYKYSMMQGSTTRKRWTKYLPQARRNVIRDVKSVSHHQRYQMTRVLVVLGNNIILYGVLYRLDPDEHLIRLPPLLITLYLVH